MKHFTCPLPFVLVGVGLAACGGGGIDTTVDADRRIFTLFEPEAMEVCLASQLYVSERFDPVAWGEFLCASSAERRVRDCYGDFTQCSIECEQTVFNCTGLARPVFEDLTPDRCRLDDWDYEECPATVGELSACITKMVDAWQSYADKMSCIRPNPYGVYEGLESECLAIVTNEDCMSLVFGD